MPMGVLYSGPGIRDARVNLGIDQVEDKGSNRNRHDHAEDDALDGGIVIRAYGPIQHAADARKAEYDLHKQRPGQDVADGQTKRRDLWQEGVSAGIAEKERLAFEPFPLRDLHKIAALDATQHLPL